MKHEVNSSSFHLGDIIKIKINLIKTKMDKSICFLVFFFFFERSVFFLKDCQKNHSLLLHHSDSCKCDSMVVALSKLFSLSFQNIRIVAGAQTNQMGWRIGSIIATYAHSASIKQWKCINRPFSEGNGFQYSNIDHLFVRMSRQFDLAQNTHIHTRTRMRMGSGQLCWLEIQMLSS